MRSKKFMKKYGKSRRMATGMNRVLPGLYIGSFADANDIEQLETHNITHILSLRSHPKHIVWHRYYLHLSVTDTEDENIAQYFYLCNNFIHKARLDDPKSNNVLVHCYAGVSRSATVVAAYLMTVAGLNWRQALQVLQNVRRIVQPNVMFLAQLRQFQIFNLCAERRRLYAKFPTRTLMAWDHLRTRALLGYYATEKYERDSSDSDIYYDCYTGDEVEGEEEVEVERNFY